MHASSGAIAKSPNFRTGEIFRELAAFGSALPVGQAIGKVCQKLWPTKPDYELAYRVDISDRACREVVAGRATLSTEKLQLLLQSEEGIAFLVAIMGDAQPHWWVRFQEQTDLHNARRKAARLQKELQETMNVVDATAAAIARTETSMAVSDEEFHRPQIDALRSVARVPNRAMAGANRRGK